MVQTLLPVAPLRAVLALALALGLVGCGAASEQAGLPGEGGSEVATLTWNANNDPLLAGYRVYVGTYSRSYDEPIDVGLTTTHTVPGLRAGRTYYFAVTAYDSVGRESAFSAEVSKSF